jgi:phosphoserine phosphatase RsbU/P
MNQAPRDIPLILIVDDDPVNRFVLDNMLQSQGFQTMQAENGRDARKHAADRHPDMILLDIMMPGETGFETLRKLKEDQATATIPVIILSALEDVDSKVKGFELGAVDYVTKPFEHMEVLARIRTNLKVVRAFRIIISEQAKRLRQVKEAQESILTKPEELPPEARFAVVYEPVLEAGGDYYDVFPISGGFGYVVADISGHDLKASFVTSGLKPLLRQNAGPLFTPGETLTNINNVLHQVLPPGQFLTLAYALLNNKRDLLTVVSAGHPPPIFVSAAGAVDILRAEGDILGPFPHVSTTPLSRPVAPGDRLYLYTDGLIEERLLARDGSADETSGLAELCLRNHDLPLGECVRRIRETLVDQAPFQDDAVLLATQV